MAEEVVFGKFDELYLLFNVHHLAESRHVNVTSYGHISAKYVKSVLDSPTSSGDLLYFSKYIVVNSNIPIIIVEHVLQSHLWGLGSCSPIPHCQTTNPVGI